jgi:hypothetical protein
MEEDLRTAVKIKAFTQNVNHVLNSFRELTAQYGIMLPHDSIQKMILSNIPADSRCKDIEFMATYLLIIVLQADYAWEPGARCGTALVYDEEFIPISDNQGGVNV